MEPTFGLERVDGSRDGSSNGAFALAFALIAAGTALLFLQADARGLVAAMVLFACGGLAYVLALRKTPRAHYFQYVWLDKDGVNHRDEPAGRIARFAWSEIDAVDAVLEDAPSIQLTLNREGVRGVPIFLLTASREHARELAKMIKLESAWDVTKPTFQRTAERPLK